MTTIDIGDAFQARQSGRTTKMINSIPEEGAVIVVHSTGAIADIRKAIVDIRGEEIAQRCSFVPVVSKFALRGLSGPVLIDHAVYDSTNITIKDVIDLHEQIAFMTNRPKISSNRYYLEYKFLGLAPINMQSISDVNCKKMLDMLLNEPYIEYIRMYKHL